MKNGTAKVTCSCKHDFQDKTYGPGVRVANATQKDTPTSIEVRCTVCGKSHTVNRDRVK